MKLGNFPKECGECGERVKKEWRKNGGRGRTKEQWKKTIAQK